MGTTFQNAKLENERKALAFPSTPKLKILVSSGPKRMELIAESCAGHPVICRPADISLAC